VTLTYYGSEKWMPHYNVMGVAKAALSERALSLPPTSARRTSASTRSRPAIKTLAFRRDSPTPLSPEVERDHSPLRRNVTIEESRQRALSALGSVARRHRRGASLDAGYHVLA